MINTAEVRSKRRKGPKSGQHASRNQDIRALWSTGHSLPGLASHFGLSEMRIRQVLSDLPAFRNRVRGHGPGRVNNLGENTNFNFRIGIAELAQLRETAREMGLSLGELIRGALTDYMEGLE